MSPHLHCVAARQRGFTLLELMIVVVIVGILASVAYPSYVEYVQRSKRADCAGALMNLASAMERRHSTSMTYVGANLGTGANDIFPATCPVDGSRATYNLAIVGATATTYALSATPTGSQSSDKCGTLTLDSAGNKGASGGSVDTCW